MSVSPEKKTVLHDRHRALGAKMVPFGGFVMPLQYAGQIAEHEAVRSRLGLFDLSHMGEFRLRGPGALLAADGLLTNRLDGTRPGDAVYSPMCREDGGIVDDLIAYHEEDSVLLVVNASNIDKDAAWVREHLPAGVSFRDESQETALLGVQGPLAEGFLSRLTRSDVKSLDTYGALRGQVAGVDALLSRTGYTGEDGFELYVAADRACALWDRLLDEGAREGLVPVGLAARDTLRFEMGYCLYGNDIDETTNPLEAGLGWTVKFDKGPFSGREALLAEKARGVRRKLVGLVPGEARQIPRHGYPVVDAGAAGNKAPIGHVTSGTFAPSLGQGLAMGYVEAACSQPGSLVGIDIRGKVVAASVGRLPFYTSGSRKAPRRPARQTPAQAGGDR